MSFARGSPRAGSRRVKQAKDSLPAKRGRMRREITENGNGEEVRVRIVFMGSPEFSVPALDALNAAGHEIVAVYCQPPRPAGRGQKRRPTPVHFRAEELGLPIRHPECLRPLAERAAFSELDSEIAVVVAYGLILPRKILDSPKYGCINIHASLLPRWRGAAPIHRAVMAGDAETGVSIMRMDAGLDTGPVFLRAATPIGATDTTGVLHDRLSAMGAALVVDYGGWRSLGDTLQAVQEHRPVDPLARPGLADLTAHVDFETLADAAEGVIHGPLTPQGVFLERLGITARANRLARSLSGRALEDHVAAHRRLTHPAEMGGMFKVIGFTPKGAPRFPGLDP